MHWPTLCRQCVAVDLPGQCALGGEAQNEICALAIQIRRPLADFFVLQVLVQAEEVEEDKDADEDAIDELRHVITGSK